MVIHGIQIFTLPGAREMPSQVARPMGGPPIFYRLTVDSMLCLASNSAENFSVHLSRARV